MNNKYAIIDFKTNTILAVSDKLSEIDDIFEKIMPDTKSDLYENVHIVELSIVR